MTDGAALYLDLMKRVLTNVIYEDPPLRRFFRTPEPEAPTTFEPAARQAGEDWPSVAHTMVGRERLDNVQWCLEQVLVDHVPGDFVETGVWRGGVCIFARAVFRAHGVDDRTVWVADSFEGIPDTDERSHPMDRRMALHEFNAVLGVSRKEVQANFGRYGLDDDQVRYLEGWFGDTLPTAPVERLAVLRLDGDLYESTTDALVHLYPKLSPGGFVIVDDYVIPACRRAVHRFRDDNDITDQIHAVDRSAVYWRRSR